MDNSFSRYITSFGKGLWSLLVGMKVTITVFFRKKTTEQYPENRDTLVLFDRFRGELVMPHDPENHHKCIACRLCEMSCPNGSIRIETEMVEDENGKKTKVLHRYEYDLGSCLFCQLCVRACPCDAIEFENTFENAVFNRSKLLEQLNRPGSSLKKREAAAAKK